MRKKRAIRFNEKKYIDNPYDNTDEFYDLDNDPIELVNLYGSNPNVKNFKKIMTDIQNQFEKKDSSPGTKFDKKTLEELKTLG